MSVLDTPRSARAVGLSSSQREDYKPAPTYRRGQTDATPVHAALPAAAPESRESPATCESPKEPDLIPAEPSPVNAQLDHPDHSLPQAPPVNTEPATSAKDTTHTTEEERTMPQDQTTAPVSTATPATSRPSTLAPSITTLSRDTSKSQRERVRIAVQHGNHTLTEIAKTTQLSRDQTSKMMSLMIRQGELRDVPTRGGERTVDMPLQKGTLQSTKNTGTPLVTTPKTLSGEQTDASTVDVITSTSNDTLPHVIAAQILSALDGVRLQVLRLAEMAKESAIAHSKLEAIQRALQEDTP